MGILKIIENFLRGEYWLHFTTAFLLSEILIKICRFPLSIYVLIIFLISLLWEIYHFNVKQTPINYRDILSSVLGGVFSVLLKII